VQIFLFGGEKMRLDKFLKVSRIIKRRTVANEACDAGRVTINGKVAKASVDVKVGDEIEIRFGSNTTKIKVKSLNENPRKEEASLMYESMQ
jgi:ribosomal 50S subunit-recycling heat shock protein